jgi:hypothetical protein
MAEPAKRLSRRSFLLAVGAGGVATAAASAATKMAQGQAQPAAKGKRATRGYHPSEHIDSYYRTTKV